MDMLTFQINPECKEPIYQQLYHHIKSEIQAGNLSCDSKLPSKRKLSNYLNISQNTIQAAYDQLLEEGYIISIEKKGFYVSRIDFLQHISISHSESEGAIDMARTANYDFSYHGIDSPSFPFDTWRKLAKEAINEYDSELLSPGDSFGNPRLRSAIASYLHQSRGVNCDADQIIISSGTEMLFQALIQLFEQDFIYGIENPGYEKLNQLFHRNRAKYRAISIDQSGVIPEQVIKSEANVLCITPAHQFPSGGIMPINRRMQLLAWANEAPNRYLIEDDYDSEFKYSGRPIPALQGLDINERVIYMGSLSKSISPTLRVSYMVLPLHLMKRFRKELSYILCPVPIFEQKVLCSFIENGCFERHLNKMRTIYKKKRDVLVKAILEMNDSIEILGAEAGLHLLLRLPLAYSEQELIQKALNHGVRTYGISNYYLDDSYSQEHPTLLLGFATMPEQDVTEAVHRLKQAWFS